MEQVTATISNGEQAVYDQIETWLIVESPTSWGGHFTVPAGQPLITNSALRGHPSF